MKNIYEITDQEIDEVASIMISKPTRCFDIYRDGEYVSAVYKREPLDWRPGTTLEMSITFMYSNYDKGNVLQVHNNWNYHHEKGVSTTQDSLHNFIEIAKYLINKGYA